MTKSLTQVDWLPVTEYMEMLQALTVKETGHPPRWGEAMKNSGYETVVFRSLAWQEAHDWCKKVCGEEHYSWSGSNFFFTRRSDALMFKLIYG